MQRLRILVILILLSLMPLYSLAVLNEGQYAFRSLDINNGLSQNTVHAILQDKQGFMWFGTKDGLDRYDGKEENGTTVEIVSIESNKKATEFLFQ